MYSRLIYLFVLLVSLISFHRVQAAFDPDRIYTSPVQLKEGLSQVVVTDIVRDARGFLWVSTFDGLNRFDGKRIKVFRHNPEDSNSIPSSKIHRLFADRDRILYLQTNDGFTMMDTRTNRLFRPEVLKNYQLKWVTTDEAGKVWFYVAGKGFLFFRINENKVEEFFDSKAKSFEDVLGLLKLGENIFAVHTNGDILKLNTRTRKQTLTRNPEPGLLFNTAGIDKFQHILLGSIGGSLTEFNPQTSSYSASALTKMNERLVAVNSIFYDSTKNVLLLSTYGQGLFVYDYATNTLQQYKKNEGRLSISANYLLKVFADPNGYVYIGYDGSGFDILDPHIRKFVPVIRKDSDDTKTIRFVRKIVEDDDGNLLIGTAGSGLVRYIPSTQTFQFFTFRNELNISENYIIEMIRYGNTLWLGFNGNGIAIVDLKTLKKERLISIGSGVNQISNGTIWSFLEDRQGRIWVGTRENGINCIQPKTWNVKQYNTSSFPFFKNNGIRCLFQSREGRILVGTEKGVFKLADDQTIVPVFPKENSIRTSTLKSIKCFYQDYKGRFWLGTDGGGIAVLNSDFALLRTFSTNDFLNNNVVYSILAENDTSFWISTNSGLSNIRWNENVLLKKANPVIRNFDETNGLQSNEFNTGAYTQLRDGRFVFGGLNGINVFHPSEIKSTAIEPQVYIDEFKVFENPLNREEDISYLSKIDLKHYENSISLSFSSLGITFPDNIKYQYRLLGYDKEWVTTSERNYVSYTNLSSGDYEFQVRCTNADGVWSSLLTRLNISIATPFYRTWWFISLAILLLGQLVFLVYKNKLNQIREKEAIRIQYTKELAEVEMKALRAQINPHFLFNSLNSINNFILRNDTKLASRYLVKFSQLVRNILNNSSATYISLGEELETIELYILIEGMRFSNQFSYQIDVEHLLPLGQIRIPSLLLQPYVENAIWHGLLHKDGEKHIRISVKRKDEEYICIEIEDNGIGRASAKELENKNRKHTSYGMSLGESRLRLMNTENGLRASVEVVDLYDDKRQATGTRISILLPSIKLTTN